MRKRTVAGIAFLISWLMVYGLVTLARANGIRLPYLGLMAHVVVALLITPILMVLVARFNRPLLEWRKRRGRDIEAEESHEMEESDMITLIPKESNRKGSR